MITAQHKIRCRLSEVIKCCNQHIIAVVLGYKTMCAGFVPLGVNA